MSNGQENNTNCEIHKFERNNYFYGKLMTVRDFETEQSYFNEKRYLLNRLVHGSGLLCGLSIDKINLADSGENIKIIFSEGGVALDCCGHEIIVPPLAEKFIHNEQGNNLIKSSLTANMYLYLRYMPCFGQKVAAASNPSSCEETCCSNRIIEDFEVVALTNPPASTPVSCPDFSLASSGSEAEIVLKNWWLTNVTGSCPSCADPTVFIAVMKSDGTIDKDDSKEHSYTVHNNKLLSDLLKCHLTDFNNPHKTTAEQVRALKTINGVGNVDENVYVRNVDLVSTKNTITRANDLSNNRIDINTIPSPTVTSVEETPDAGSSSTFSPGDHIHDLADGVVTRPKLNSDVINELIDHDDTIAVTPDDANKKIHIKTNPATQVTSVGSAKVTGVSNRFSPDDHVHDLSDNVVERRHLNSDVIHNLIDSDGSITIESDDTNKKISIKTANRGACNTGVVIFPSDSFKSDDLERLHAVSGWIDPKLGEGNVCVILGIEQGEKKMIFIGHEEISGIFQFPKVFLGAVVDPRRGRFRIGVIQNEALYIESMRVRWWASMPGEDLGEVTVISVRIDPANTSLPTGAKFEFSAIVTGTTNTDVDWDIQETNGGKIEPVTGGSCIYYAPDQQGTYHVIAKSREDPSKTGTATVDVMAPDIKYVAYKVFEDKKLIVRDGLCQDGVKNCIQEGDKRGGGYYALVGSRIALNGVPGKLVALVLEQTIADKKTLSPGESWEIGGGWTLTVQAIDARAQPRQAWLVLSYGGNKLDEIVAVEGSVYSYSEKEIAGETGVPVFVTYIDSIFAGATSDMMQLRYTWAVSRNIMAIDRAVRRKKKPSPK